ncbi:hypothetical protein THAOC_36901, partial [Thalassiosira oceanica]
MCHSCTLISAPLIQGTARRAARNCPACAAAHESKPNRNRERYGSLSPLLPVLRKRRWNRWSPRQERVTLVLIQSSEATITARTSFRQSGNDVTGAAPHGVKHQRGPQAVVRPMLRAYDDRRQVSSSVSSPAFIFRLCIQKFAIPTFIDMRAAPQQQCDDQPIPVDPPAKRATSWQTSSLTRGGVRGVGGEVQSEAPSCYRIRRRRAEEKSKSECGDPMETGRADPVGSVDFPKYCSGERVTLGFNARVSMSDTRHTNTQAALPPVDQVAVALTASSARTARQNGGP